MCYDGRPSSRPTGVPDFNDNEKAGFWTDDESINVNLVIKLVFQYLSNALVLKEEIILTTQV